MQHCHHIFLLGPKALISRCDDLPATITYVPVAAVLVLNTPDDGRLRPKHVEWLCRNKTCRVLHQVGVSFDLYYDAGKHKIKVYVIFLAVCFLILHLWSMLHASGQYKAVHNNYSHAATILSFRQQSQNPKSGLCNFKKKKRKLFS